MFPPGGNERTLPAAELQDIMRQQSIDYLRKVETRFQKDESVFKAFSYLLFQYLRGNKTMNELFQEVAMLFANHNDLLQEFINFIPRTSQPVVKRRPLPAPHQHGTRVVAVSEMHSSERHGIDMRESNLGVRGEPHGIVMRESNFGSPDERHGIVRENNLGLAGERSRHHKRAEIARSVNEDSEMKERSDRDEDKAGFAEHKLSQGISTVKPIRTQSELRVRRLPATGSQASLAQRRLTQRLARCFHKCERCAHMEYRVFNWVEVRESIAYQEMGKVSLERERSGSREAGRENVVHTSNEGSLPGQFMKMNPKPQTPWDM